MPRHSHHSNVSLVPLAKTLVKKRIAEGYNKNKNGIFNNQTGMPASRHPFSTQQQY